MQAAPSFHGKKERRRSRIERVAAYCRVSTDHEDQASSLASQKKYFSEYIERNPLWELYDIYADEGITGTSTRKRRSFQRMIADAQASRFDLIVTKEISRFARNTLDSIFYTRRLKELGIGVIFLNDNINTLDPDAELRLTILSSIAQEESRKTSDRVKWGQKRRMEQGVVFGRDMLGYDVKNGKLYINEAGAETVRLIFHKFVNEEKGSHVIARELREACIPTAAYMQKWSNTVILRVLRNEKYCGDLVQKKTFTPNYLNHQKKYNRGEEELVIIRDHHEPIISREMFERARRELKRRSPAETQKAKHSSRYCFSGKIRCGICGCTFVSRTKKRHDGSVCKAWRCYEGARHGMRHTDTAGNEVGCDSRSIHEEDLRAILQQVIRNLPLDKEAILNRLCSVVQSVRESALGDDRPEKLQARLDTLRRKKQSLLELYLNGEIGKPDFQQMTERYEAELASIEQNREALENQKTPCEAAGQDLTENTIRGLAWGAVWDDTFYRHMLDKIVIREDSVFEVYLHMLPEKLCYFITDAVQLRKKWAELPAAAKGPLPRHFGSSEGTEELGHLEMIGTIVHQLTRNLSEKDVTEGGFGAYFIDHTTGVYPTAASGSPWNAAGIGVKGDVIADLTEDMAAEQKARVTYDNILRVSDDPDVSNVIRFLREREVIHFQRFGEAVRLAKEKMDQKNIYFSNPAFDH